MSDNILFDEWNEVKKKTDKIKPFEVLEGFIYWISIGQNIGYEVYGKGKTFARPVLVIKRFKYSNFSTFLGVPISSKVANKSGFMFYHFDDSKGKKQVALLAQIRVFDTRRKLNKFNAKSSKDDFSKLKEKVRSLI